MGSHGRAPRRASRPTEALELLGRVAETLSPDDLPSSIDTTLEILRRAFGADDCEIFLRGPDGDAVLFAARGRDGALLAKRSRFAPGSGHPGIVAKTARPLSTRALHRDPRYLRPEVPAHGIRACIAVPLLGSGEVLGTLHVYWRRPRLALDSVLRVAEQVARPISTTLRAGMARFRERIDAIAGGGAEASDFALDALLEEIRSVAGARSAALAIFGEGAPRLRGPSSLLCGELKSGPCPMVRSGAIGLEQPAASGCPATLEPGGRPSCIPLSSAGTLRGVLRLDYPKRASQLPSRAFVPLLAMAGGLAAQLGRGGPMALPPSGARLGTASRVRIHCFGPLRVERDGKTLPRQAFVRSKALVLLKLLLLRGGRPLSRDAIIERLWPGVGQQAGANRLHGVVHALRSALEPRGDEPGARCICNEGEQYFFNAEAPHPVDLFAFRSLLEQGLRALRLGQKEPARQALEGALSVAEGDLFEDDLGSFEAERSEIRERRLEAIGRLAAILSESGEIDAALDQLRRGLQLDPLREDFHQEVIRLLLRCGRRNDALAQYRSCEQLLRMELGAELLPETRALRGVLGI